MPKAHKSLAIKRWNGSTLQQIDDQVSMEEPLEIRLGYYEGEVKRRVNVSITMRTPGSDEELARGFLFSESIIEPNHIESVRRVDPGFRKTQRDNIIQVDLKPGIQPNMDLISRNFYTTSSCGVCGKTSIELVQDLMPAVIDRELFRVSPKQISQLPQRVKEYQQEFDRTGGIHAACLFNDSMELEILREDVGRHNALDKLIGAAMQSRTFPLKKTLLLLSGRASFELIQKAAKAGIPVVAAIGAPSSLAVELAEESEITLIGFLKSDRMNVYSGFERIHEE